MNEQTRTQQQEIDENYEYFKALLPEILTTRKNKFALLRNCQILGYFDTIHDALEAGRAIGEENYSIQKVSDRTVDLGHFSHVNSLV